MKGNKLRLIVLSFLEFAVWGAYLTSQADTWPASVSERR